MLGEKLNSAKFLSNIMLQRKSRVRFKDKKSGTDDSKNCVEYAEIEKLLADLEGKFNAVYDLFLKRIAINPKEKVFGRPYKWIKKPYKALFSEISQVRKTLFADLDSLNTKCKKRLLIFITQRMSGITKKHPLIRKQIGKGIEGRKNMTLLYLQGDLIYILEKFKKKLEKLLKNA